MLIALIAAAALSPAILLPPSALPEPVVRMKTVGAVGPSRGGMPRCRWQATIAGPDGPTELSGERPGDCLIHRAAIRREIATKTAR